MSVQSGFNTDSSAFAHINLQQAHGPDKCNFLPSSLSEIQGFVVGLWGTAAQQGCCLGICGALPIRSSKGSLGIWVNLEWLQDQAGLQGKAQQVNKIDDMCMAH